MWIWVHPGSRPAAASLERTVLNARAIAHHARGGLIEQPTLSYFAEEGPEMAIPIEDTDHARGLWALGREASGSVPGKPEGEQLWELLPGDYGWTSGRSGNGAPGHCRRADGRIRTGPEFLWRCKEGRCGGSQPEQAMRSFWNISTDSCLREGGWHFKSLEPKQNYPGRYLGQDRQEILRG